MTAKHNPIDNLQISLITNDVLLIHQIKPPAYFSCSDGLLILPRKGRNSTAIALDVNIEPNYVEALVKEYGPVSDYVNTHGHMDHIAHVHAWETASANIYAPEQEAETLTNLQGFYNCYDWQEMNNPDAIEQFAELNGYQPCKKVNAFKPGAVFRFDDLTIETIPFTGHSAGHVGFFLPAERILHISCLGFDKQNPEANGFGPWYGFEQCSIAQYIKDIEDAGSLFLQKADFLTSSHGYVIGKSDNTPFEYMNQKLEKNQWIVDQALNKLGSNLAVEEEVNKLLKQDLFFPKAKMKGFLFDIYTFWESWMIRHHLDQKMTGST